MADSVFHFTSYQDYLNHCAGQPGTRKGHRSAMARTMGCHSSYLTKVLNNRGHISLEQAYRLNSYLHHSSDEAHFFLLLVQKGRAGTKELEKYFDTQIQEILQKRLLIQERIHIKNSLSKEDQAIYYSNGYYAALHVALTIPTLRTPKALAEYFGLPLSKVTDVLLFLTSKGLAFENRGIYQTGEVQIHLGNQSPHLSQHHTHWRLQAISSLNRERNHDLHYSSVVSLSQADVLRLKNEFIEIIKKVTYQISHSKEEVAYCFCMDFFDLRSKE